jgi:hypothetical protein
MGVRHNEKPLAPVARADLLRREESCRNPEAHSA